VRRTEYTALIGITASSLGLDPNIVEALVIRESGGNKYAFRPELNYPYLWDVALNRPFRKLHAGEASSKEAPTDFPFLAGGRQQEWVGQQTSWGLMQIMGALARERGFSAPYLDALTDPDENLRVGCGHLAELFKWAAGDEAKALGAWNAGRGGWDLPVAIAYAGKILEVRSNL